MADRILLTGAGGFVAGSIMHQSAGVPALYAVSRGPAPRVRANVHWHQADVRDAAAMKAVFDEVRPQAVIHTAAIADIDFSQANQDTAREMNVTVTRSIAELCAAHDAKLVHCSTDNVFDGARGHYAETDPVRAVNFYGQTKIDAEAAVRAATANAVVARVALVMGLPVVNSGNSFLAKFIAAWKAGQEVGVPDEEIRSPIDVITLGGALLELAENDFTGNIQLGGNDTLNRYVMARQIAGRLGYAPELVTVKNPSAIPGRAPRPRDVSFDNALARRTLKTPMLGIDGALDLIVSVEASLRA